MSTIQVRQQNRSLRFRGAKRFWRRFSRQRLAVGAGVVITLIVACAVLAPWIAPYDPTATDLGNSFAAPGPSHWLGTDDLGRDVLSRIFYGARISLIAAAIAVVLAVAVGVPIGLVSGFFSGRVDAVIMRINDSFMSFPFLLLAIAIIGFIGPGVINAMIAVGIVYAPRFVRVARACALTIGEETYMQASKQIGCGTFRLISRHVLPNALSPIVVQTSLAMALAVLAEASLSFIGLGVQPPEASLGAMLERAFRFISHTPTISLLAPGVVITLMVLSFNLIGDGLRDSVGREVRK